MEMMLKLAGIVLVALSVAMLIRQNLPSFSPIYGCLAVVVCILVLLPEFRVLAVQVGGIVGKTGIDSNFFVVARVLIVTTVGKVAGELCRDNGEKALGLVAELCGSGAGVLCALPLFAQVLKAVGGGF